MRTRYTCIAEDYARSYVPSSALPRIKALLLRGTPRLWDWLDKHGRSEVPTHGVLDDQVEAEDLVLPIED